MSETPTLTQRLPPKTFAIIFGVSLATAMGNTGMQSVLPAIGRSIGFPDYLVAAVFSLSALLWAGSSPFWARQSERSGQKRMMVVGLMGFMVSMTLCALVVWAGLRHMAVPLTIFFLFLLARALFGLFGSASNPATQAFVAQRTSRETRTQALAGLAGAFGLGTIIGPAVAPLFVLPLVGLSGPMFAFAVFAGVMVLIVLRYLPATPPSQTVSAPSAHTDLRADEAAGKPLPMWRDPKLAPYLGYAFLVATCQAAQGQTLGFVIIDKLHLPPLQAQGFTAVALMAGAVAGLLAQWGLIGMFRLGPRSLLRWGVALAAGANLLLAFAPTYTAVVMGYALSSLGYGFCRPGFTAGASLAVGEHEQARAAGGIAAANGISIIAAPLFVLLYGSWRPGPFVVDAILLAGLLVFTLVNKALANAGQEPTREEDTTESTLERNRDGGSL